MLELGLGAFEVLSAGGRGTVVAVFAKAVYARFPAGLVARTTTGVPPGPLHARGAYPARRWKVGDVMTVDLEGARLWRGSVPSPGRLEAGADLALEVLGSAPPSALADPAFAPRVDTAVRQLGAGRVDGVVDALGGLGPGMTPSGDDALAGILLLARAMWGEVAEPTLVRSAAGSRTNDIAAAFLAWAARGQSIEPVHRVLTAAAQDDRARATAALDELLGYGHSSGADLALGLRLGIGAFCCSRSMNAV